MSKLRQIYDALTRARVEREASQAVHPADELRAQLGHDAVSQVLVNIVRLAGEVGHTLIESYRSEESGSSGGAANDVPEAGIAHGGTVVDITGDNPHLGNSQQ